MEETEVEDKLIRFEIFIEDDYGINDIVPQFPDLGETLKKECIEIEIVYSCGQFLKGEIFAVIVAYIFYLQENGIEVKLVYDPDENCDTIKYAARINFFRLLGIPFSEQNRLNSSGRFVEITPFNRENLYDVAHEVVKIFKTQFDLEEDVLNCINHCFGEIVDNVETHVECGYGGIIYAQFFPRLNRLRIFIIDNGIGIHKSLTKNSLYSDNSEEESLCKCLEKGVTDGEGKGMGLFHSSLFILANKGTIKINSCGKEIGKHGEQLVINDTPYWQGTIVSMSVKTDVKVNYETVFEGHTPLTFEELDECRNEKQDEVDEITSLW